MIWFTADTHFGHENILKLASRPWRDIGQMNRALISNINACVLPADDLWILGDFSFRITREEAAAIRERIRCRNVHLIAGNHDKDWSRPEVAGTFITDPPICELKAEGRRLVLCHYPMEDWPGMGNGSIHLHGHIHTEGSDYNELNRMQKILRYDVGVDANGYRPVSLKEILAWFDGVKPEGYRAWPDWVVSTDNEEAHEYARALQEENEAEDR